MSTCICIFDNRDSVLGDISSELSVNSGDGNSEVGNGSGFIDDEGNDDDEEKLFAGKQQGMDSLLFDTIICELYVIYLSLGSLNYVYFLDYNGKTEKSITATPEISPAPKRKIVYNP